MAGDYPPAPGISPLRASLQLSPDLGVAVIEIRVELQRPVGIHKRGLVDHEHGHWGREIVSGGAALTALGDPLIDRVDRFAHEQGG